MPSCCSPSSPRWTTERRVALGKTEHYARAFVYGRTRIRRTLQGVQQERVPQEKWHTLLLNAHPGYISWDEYQENQRRLQENAHALGPERRKSPPREGPALLQ